MPPISATISHHFQAKEIRDILKSKAHCLRAGFSPDDVIIETMDDIRNGYIRDVGLSTYLSQMLGPVATQPIKCCHLFKADGQQLKFHLNGNQNQPLQRFLMAHFRLNELPFRIEVHLPDKNKTDIRYL